MYNVCLGVAVIIQCTFFPFPQDMNPIENVWAQLKHYLHKVEKPTTKEGLLQGINNFWSTKMTPALCKNYINHLKKVIPAVIEREGGPSGY